MATIASLAVGVAVVVAIQLANASSVRGFSTALDALAGRTSLEITVPGVGVDEVVWPTWDGCGSMASSAR